MNVSGVVKKVYTKNGYYSLIIDDVFYGCGKKNPGNLEGATVSFDYDTNDKGFHQIKGAISKSGGAPASSGGGGSGKVNGASVGMAINNAVAAFVGDKITREEIPEFATKILKLSSALEKGKTFDGSAAPAEPKPAPPPPPEPEEDEFDDDVPF